METILNFIKKQFAAILILLVSSVIISYLLIKYVHNDPQDPITNLVSQKVTEFKDELKHDNARIVTNKSSNISGISLEEYNALKQRYNDKSIEFEAFTNINAVLQESLRIAKLQMDEANNKVWYWENKKPSGSNITATMNEKDSVLHTSVDVKLNITDVVDKGGLFKKDRFYTDFYSPDQNIKINGVQNFRKETVIKPKRLGIGFQAGYGVTGEFKTSPYFGIGISYNILNL